MEVIITLIITIAVFLTAIAIGLWLIGVAFCIILFIVAALGAAWRGGV